jgi:hypothetical protein
MFCLTHLIPQEDCAGCRGTVATMRPTIFAELAAAELASGTECCPRCNHLFYEAVANCPQCGEPSPLQGGLETLPMCLEPLVQPERAAPLLRSGAGFIDLDALALLDPAPVGAQTRRAG